MHLCNIDTHFTHIHESIRAFLYVQGLLLALEWVHRCGTDMRPSQVDALLARLIVKLKGSGRVPGGLVLAGKRLRFAHAQSMRRNRADSNSGSALGLGSRGDSSHSRRQAITNRSSTSSTKKHNTITRTGHLTLYPSHASRAATTITLGIPHSLRAVHAVHRAHAAGQAYALSQALWLMVQLDRPVGGRDVEGLLRASVMVSSVCFDECLF